LGAAPAAVAGFGQATDGSCAVPAAGAFGAPAANARAFGDRHPTGGWFGAPAATGVFGAATRGAFDGAAFGAPKLTFGATAAVAFGSVTTGGDFNALNSGLNSGGFGAPAASAAFRAPAAGGGLIAPASSGAFGAPANGAFGAHSFGAHSCSTHSTGGFTGFGAAAGSAPGQGTAAAKWTQTQGIDGTTNASTTEGQYMAITHMPQYHKYSFEELRVQDYEAGRTKIQPGAGSVAALLHHPASSSPSPSPRHHPPTLALSYLISFALFRLLSLWRASSHPCTHTPDAGVVTAHHQRLAP